MFGRVEESITEVLEFVAGSTAYGWECEYISKGATASPQIERLAQMPQFQGSKHWIFRHKSRGDEMFQSLVRPFKKLLPQGKRYRKLLMGPASGCVMEIDFSSQVRPYFGIFEAELNPYYRRMVTPGSNCFDVGGAEGYNALMMAKLSGGKVISFDNDPAEIEHMRDVFSQNPELQIQVVQTFVGTTDGDGYMSIDRASREFFPPNFIKLDIEGGEDMALEGASCPSPQIDHRSSWGRQGKTLRFNPARCRLFDHDHQPELVLARSCANGLQPLARRRSSLTWARFVTGHDPRHLQ